MNHDNCEMNRCLTCLAEEVKLQTYAYIREEDMGWDEDLCDESLNRYTEMLSEEEITYLCDLHDGEGRDDSDDMDYLYCLLKKEMNLSEDDYNEWCESN